MPMPSTKNTKGLALAYKRAKAKLAKIAELGITPKTTESALNKIIKARCEAKAKEDPDGNSWEYFARGQEYYIHDLQQFSKLSIEEALNAEYEAAFGDVSSEAEMIAKLKAEFSK